MRSLRRAFVLLATGLVICMGRPALAAPEGSGDKKFDVEIKKDIAYYEGEDADKVRHKLDLYLPKDQKDFPVVMFVHGGAWIFGSKSFPPMHADVGKFFAQHGIGCVVPNYRLSPGVKHPEHVKDVARAFAWMKKNIKNYGGDPDQLFLTGHSAGGHLVALLATDDTYLKAEGCTLKDIKGVMPVSGVYKIDPPQLFENVFGKDEEVLKKASPINDVHEGEPPFLIICADKDLPGIAACSGDFCKVFKDAKLSAELLKVEDRDHMSILTKGIKDGDVVGKAMLDFIRDHGKK